MAFKYIEEFKCYPHQINIKRLLKIADTHDISTCSFNNHLHLACNILKKEYKNDSFEILHTYMDFDKIFKVHDQPNLLEKLYTEMWCGYYDEQYSYHEDYFVTRLNDLMNCGKIIFVFLDFHDYILIDQIKKSEYHSLSSHSTGVLFYPNKTGSYNVFHFNPHGQAGTDINYYQQYITRKRQKKINISTSLDRFVMAQFVDIYNKKINDFSERPIYIQYKPDKYYNYVGPNLQTGDTHGICFTFPFILFNELCRYFDTSSFLKDRTYALDRRFPCCDTLIKCMDFHKIIYIMISRIFKDIKYYFLHYYVPGIDTNKKNIHNTGVSQWQMGFNNTLEQILEGRGSMYIKLVFSEMMNFIMQPAIKNIVDQYLDKEK